MRTCEVCNQPQAKIRLDMQEGAWGPVARPICAACYAKDCEERRDEGRRLGYRPRIVSWDKLEVLEDGQGDG